MAAAVLALLDDQPFAARVITAGVRKARAFGWAAVWPRLRRVYVP